MYLRKPIQKIKSEVQIRLIRYYTASENAKVTYHEEMQNNFIATNIFQKALLTCGSAVIALLDPHRGDMIACLGEVTGENAIKYMHSKMLQTEEGQDILKNKPRINSKTIAFETLSQMPENSLGRVYADFMKDNNITADSRLPVQFIADPELAYVMQRYREVHDLVHASLFMKTNMLGEVTVKWVEGIQTKLPMCIGGGIWGAARLRPKHRQMYLKYYLPWAIRTGNNAKFLQGIYFEKRWEQDIDDFHKEMNIVRLLKK
ncbi:ubiquinone biosynthesis protein COQ4 homolog, mitochondrial [Bombyx mandarina]|uniref:Ubiquinone biosynthesis protein COQ4 homolog, mitochondrial n=2 Tax=Bombyx TaxID=7090 RepID=COQ4_BOMMO|nr:ubiquinone biosynthesis protein COQ4 homolog, mitochondrial [Bombyx mori]XP_028035863.1 ubiquinone biosynthesis protein COQ4 homolog, mitochondrial [Bombyx mandarina]Q1HPV1.1 RecName: Full=Ubiquinone biosynthesis protein COQ4 homolog, mitochondrial; AltName: Full=Coenzyme Q biosynthesis protein 4 homolog [Bombyx mori]ABF51390.1 coenzyme Q4-like protein [Bombyx mori]